jgi:hypothetical protein
LPSHSGSPITVAHAASLTTAGSTWRPAPPHALPRQSGPSDEASATEEAGASPCERADEDECAAFAAMRLACMREAGASPRQRHSYQCDMTERKTGWRGRMEEIRAAATRSIPAATDAVHHRIDVAALGGRHFRMARPRHERATLVGVAPRGQHMHGSEGDHCCARAASGHAAAPSRSVMKSRLRIGTASPEDNCTTQIIGLAGPSQGGMKAILQPARAPLPVRSPKESGSPQLQTHAQQQTGVLARSLHRRGRVGRALPVRPSASSTKAPSRRILPIPTRPNPGSPACRGRKRHSTIGHDRSHRATYLLQSHNFSNTLRCLAHLSWSQHLIQNAA